MRNVKRPASLQKPNVPLRSNTFNKWGKRIVGGLLAVTVGTVAYKGLDSIAQKRAIKQKEKQQMEQTSRMKSISSKVGVRGTNSTQQAKSYTNNIPRLKAVFAKRVTLTKTHLQAFDSIASIAQKTGFGSGRILQNIIIYQKEFSNPNYQRAPLSEKQRMLGTGDARVIAIGDAFGKLPQSERNGIRTLLAVKGVKEEVWGIAGEERVKANREAMGFSD